MTTPTGRLINVPAPSTCAELFVNGAKVSGTNPVPVTGGTGGGGGGGPVTVANGADVATGATTDAEASGNGSVVAILKRIRTLLSGTIATSRTWTLLSSTDSVNVGNFPGTQPVSGTVTANTGLTQPLTDAQLRATAVPVSGTVSVSNFPATQPVSVAATVPVSGSFWQVTQPVSLATNTPDVTDRAARLLGHVTVDNASLAVTGTFFPATQPVSAVSLPLPTGAAQDGTDITTPTAMPAGGAGIRGWLSAIWTKLNGTLAVTGTFWQATQPVSLATAPTTPVTGTFWQSTQPVSLATNTPDVTDRAARLLGHVTVDSAPTTPVTGTFFQATQPVSLATNTPTLAAGTNTVGNLNEIRAATAYATVVSAAISAGATLTLAAAGAGLFHYITSIEITNYTGIARTGGATPVTVTTTNITGSPAYTFATAAAIGTTDIQRPILATPLKTAVANTATTIVAPVVTGSFWRINVTYFVGP